MSLPLPEDIRAAIADQFAAVSNTIDETRALWHTQLDEGVQNMTQANDAARIAAFRAAGLNPDGSIPPDFPRDN